MNKLIAVLLALAMTPALGQGYPNKPVRILIAQAPGSLRRTASILDLRSGSLM